MSTKAQRDLIRDRALNIKPDGRTDTPDITKEHPVLFNSVLPIAIGSVIGVVCSEISEAIHNRNKRKK